MEFRILGPLEVVSAGSVVPLARQHRILLSALLLSAGRTVSVDRLRERLWDVDPPRARTALHTAVMRLRRRLGGAGIATASAGYRIDLGEARFDLFEFERRWAAAERAAIAGDLAHEDRLLTDALALWRGDPLSDVPSEVLRREELPRLTELRLAATGRQIDVWIARGRHPKAIVAARTQTILSPLRERGWHQLMQALHLTGRSGEALATYAQLRNLMIEQLGIEPTGQLRDLQQAILTGGSVVPPRRIAVSSASGFVPAPAVAPDDGWCSGEPGRW